jgi:AraC-like DNA-binding protein
MATFHPRLVDVSSLAMDSSLWRGFSTLERIAAHPGRIHAWSEVRAWRPDEPGELHTNPTTVVCLGGVVRVERPGERLDLHPGDVLLIGPGVWHWHAPLRHGSSWFGQGFLMTWSDWVVAGGGATWYGSLSLQPTLQLVEAAIAAPPADRPKTAAAWLAQLVGERFTVMESRQSAAVPMAAVMWRRLCAGVTAEEMAAASGLSRAAAFKAFAGWFGLPPGRAIAHCRLTLAAVFLAQGMGVAETARRCGYAVPDTFTRAWRRRHGATPWDWQQTARGADAGRMAVRPAHGAMRRDGVPLPPAGG